jgi:cyclophilin family peptidyl-prolyl cis-trans isomerase
MNRAKKSVIWVAIFLLICGNGHGQNKDGNKAIEEAQKIFRQWRKEHLLQETASLEARILNTRLLRLRTAKDASKRKGELERLHKRARKSYQAMQTARARAASAFATAGRAIEAALKKAPKNARVHSWRAELFATLASSGRSVGSVLGPKPRGLMSFKFFQKGLESAEIAYNDKKNDPLRTFLKARLLGVFNRYKEACAVLEPLIKSPNALPRDRLLLATFRFYLNDFDGALKLLAHVKDAASSRAEALELKRVVCHAKKLWDDERKLLAASKNRPQVILELEKGRIVLELFEDEAPNTVANFIHLVDKKFYDQTRFHRVLSSFVAQVGDPNTRTGQGTPGTGGPGWTIEAEIHKKSHSHFRGTVAMARGKGKNSGGSQFYLCLVPVPYMNGQSTVFGRVLEGIDQLAKIRAGAKIVKATVKYKRDHPYVPKKMKGP